MNKKISVSIPSDSNLMEEIKKKEDELAQFIQSCLDADPSLSLYMPHSKAPWRNNMRSFLRFLKSKTGKSYTSEEALKRLDLKYNPVHEAFKGLKNVKSYATKTGYVDSVRQDQKQLQYLYNCADKLGMPFSYLIELVCDCKLKSKLDSGNYLERTSKEIEEYLAKPPYTLDGLKRENQSLYNRLDHIQEYSQIDGIKVLKSDILISLGFSPSIWPELAEKEYSEFSQSVASSGITTEKAIANALKRKGIEKSEKKTLCSSDFEPHEYKAIVDGAIKSNVYVVEYLKPFGIEYTGGLKIDRLSHFRTDELSGIDEMKQYRDSKCAKLANKSINNMSPEEFEQYIQACKEAYEMFSQEKDITEKEEQINSEEAE